MIKAEQAVLDQPLIFQINLQDLIVNSMRFIYNTNTSDKSVIIV